MRSAFVVVMMLFMVGCSHMPRHVWYETQEELEAKHSYKKALEQLTVEQPQSKKRIAKLQRKAKQFRIAQLKKVETQMAQKKWGEARDTLNYLIDTQPWHDDYAKMQLTLQSRKNEEIRLLETKHALAKANLLKAELQLEDFFDREQSAWHLLTSRQATLKEQKQELAKTLFELSVKALAVQDYYHAQQTYGQALALDRNLNATLLSDAINLGVYQSNKKAIQRRQNRLIFQLKQAIDEQDFDQIIHLQSILANPPFEGKQVENILTLANQTRTETAMRLDSKADNVYRDGDIETAISLWKQAVHLAPDLLGVQDKLARAVKVMKKLATLRQIQS